MNSIGLNTVINARSLGGYVMSDGRKIKKGLLLRGGSLAKASDADLERLHEVFDVRQIFDFRTEGEVKWAPDRIPEGAKHLWLPTIDPETEKMGDRNLPADAYRHLDTYLIDHSSDPFVRRISKKMYWDIVSNEYSQLQYSAFLQIISTMTEGAVFWHCSQGKDRTGLGAAFLLCALGADRETIVRDFDISNECYRDEIERLCNILKERGGGEEDMDTVRSFIGANRMHFEETLDAIDRTYGSLENYVQSILMLSDGDIGKLRDRFLE